MKFENREKLSIIQDISLSCTTGAEKSNIKSVNLDIVAVLINKAKSPQHKSLIFKISLLNEIYILTNATIKYKRYKSNH